MERLSVSAILHGVAPQFGISVTTEQLKQFDVYYAELLRWNRTTNLTTITDTEDVAIKHFLDSLIAGKELPESARLIDVGSGAGFPGIPIKIDRPRVDVTLLESSHKKVAFLRHLIGTLELRGITAECARLRDFAATVSTLYTHATVRAVNIEEVIEDLVGIMDDRGEIILCRAKPLESSQISPLLQLMREQRYELPNGRGSRTVSILGLRAERSAHVPRGTLHHP